MANMVAKLQSKFEFKIVTRNRDCGDVTIYPDIEPFKWYPVESANVCYLTEDWPGIRKLYEILTEGQYDILYLNSLFSPRFTALPLLLRRLKRLPSRPVILAPRGEFAPAALAQKIRKKRPFLAATKAIKFYDGLVWQASSEFEQADIERVIGSDSRVWIAPDLAASSGDPVKPASIPEKHPGELKLLFLSRVCKAKNLIGALKHLSEVRGRIRFDIAGPIEDAPYWETCKAMISQLPDNVSVRYRGEVQRNQVASIMADYDLFFLPTLGENFGHVILEALSAGCPVLISDRTPWRGLEQAGIGWDLPIERADLFRSALESCVDMDGDVLEQLREQARAYADRYLVQKDAISQSESLFRTSVAAPVAPAEPEVEAA
jgi:glycosyltransferase involved in cell wall biosynthesis